jgi:hypothetical protein
VNIVIDAIKDVIIAIAASQLRSVINQIIEAIKAINVRVLMIIMMSPRKLNPYPIISKMRIDDRSFVRYPVRLATTLNKKNHPTKVILFGAPTGIRTPVVALKGPRPSPLDDGGRLPYFLSGRIVSSCLLPVKCQ